MRRCLVCSVLLCMAAFLLFGQEALTNDTIIKLAKAGLGEDVIVGMVNNQPGKYSLAATDVLALKGAGVSDKVIAAMIKKNEGAAARPAEGAARPPVTPVADSQEVPELRSVHKIFIEKMENNLDQYLRAEFAKQFKDKRVIVVLDVAEADGILTGVGEETKGTGAKITGRYLGLHDVATGSLTLLDRSGKHILWSDEAGDRSLLFGVMKRGGQRKVADRLVSKLKKAIQSAP